jgi:hypothetical protein
VHQRVAAVQLQLVERDPRRLLEGGQVRLVVRVLERRTTQCGKGSAHPAGGEVLHRAVVLVPAGVLTGQVDGQVAQGADASVHSGHPSSADAGGCGGDHAGPSHRRR